ncbi:hypothetical protein [Paenibacillus riograndensis]|uniref:hypothetical protein n=1 Tax=Paenibacillus riograndensis TaxID=483937 RepID=UPI001E4E3556|nr:hypothetical protein [Paenibacillus riograndensis]
MFRIALGDDQTQNLQAALLFECYLDRLDEADQLDGLKHLAHVYGSMHRWHKVDELAKEMLRLATIRYKLQRQSDRRESDENPPEKTLTSIFCTRRLSVQPCVMNLETTNRH